MKLLLIIIFIFSFENLSQAQDKASDWPSGSSMYEGLKANERRDSLLIELSKSHEELIDVVKKVKSSDSRLITALKTQNDAWLSYSKQECELVGSLSGAGGTWPSAYASLCHEKLVKERLQIVKAATNCFQKSELNNQNECLYPLAGFYKLKQKQH